MDHEDYKYIVVAAYRCQREYMNEKAAEFLDKDLYVPDGPDDQEGDAPMELVEEHRPDEVPSDPEGDEGDQKHDPGGPETLDDAVEGLAQRDEWITVYLTRPLRGRTTHYVVQAAEEILLQLKQTGLHALAGGDPAGNSTAELGIKWAKAAGSRWKRGWYRGPAMDVKRGHLIAREDGGLTVAKSVKFGALDPENEVKGIRFIAIAEGLPEVGEEIQNFLMVHGRLRAWRFSALGLAMNAQLGLHRDLHNFHFCRNYVLPLRSFEKGALWVQDEEDMDMGFNVDHRALAEGDEEPGALESCAFAEIHDYDFLCQEEGQKPLPARDHGEWVRDRAAATMMKIVKKAEVQYTKGMEELLSEIKESGKPLEVTHNVSLSDVRKSLEAWKQALKEFQNLRDSKNAFSVRRRNELPHGCMIVPCKGVYTVKPGKGGDGFRRKARFVACGNHVQEEEGTFDLFAAGGWLGEAVAREPPAIAYELGLASPGEVWFMEQAIYGLRESPALWSRFRDEQLKLARWTMDVDGVPTTMKLQQMVSDNLIWKILPKNGGEEIYRYVVVYIDDLLLHAEEGAMKGFFEWVSAKWEVDALDDLDYDHPIRVLGMELHRVPGGVELAQQGFNNETSEPSLMLNLALRIRKDPDEAISQLDIYTDSSFAPSGGRSQ
ncbi:GIP, partial [Symbiodinium sp. CCMP2456]